MAGCWPALMNVARLYDELLDCGGKGQVRRCTASTVSSSPRAQSPYRHGSCARLPVNPYGVRAIRVQAK